MTKNTFLRRTIRWAAVLGGLGVAIGAFGAHGLDAFLQDQGYEAELIERRVAQFDVGVRYHLIHSVALLAMAGIPLGSLTARRWVTRLMVAGVALFSGSLYALVLTNTPVLGAITPLGGVSWIIAWGLLLWVAAGPAGSSDGD